MLDQQVMQETLEIAQRIDAKLEVRLSSHASAISELRSAGVAERSIRALYPFSTADYRVRLEELTDQIAFPHQLGVDFINLHISQIIAHFLPKAVRDMVNFEADRINPYATDPKRRTSLYFFTRGDILLLAACAYHLAAYDLREELAAQQTLAPYPFDLNRVAACWAALHRHMAEAELAVNQLVRIGA